MKSLPIAQRNDCVAAVPEFEGLRKADPHFYKAGFVDLLLGIETWSEIVLGQIERSHIGLCVQSTRFGYTIFGSVEATQTLKASSSFVGRVLSKEDDSKRFWEDEELSEDPIISPEERKAIDYYATTVRADDACFIVRLPLMETLNWAILEKQRYNDFFN